MHIYEVCMKNKQTNNVFQERDDTRGWNYQYKTGNELNKTVKLCRCSALLAWLLFLQRLGPFESCWICPSSGPLSKWSKWKQREAKRNDIKVFQSPWDIFKGPSRIQPLGPFRNELLKYKNMSTHENPVLVHLHKAEQGWKSCFLTT